VKSLQLRLGESADAITIAAVATHVFLDTYATDGVRPDLAREVFELCSPQAFAAALAQPERRFVVATTDAGLVGFAELLLEDRPAEVAGVTGAELVRLYVQPRAHGAGVGRALVLRCEELVASSSLPAMWLTVWEHNEAAMAFYRRLAFTDAGPGTYTYEDQVYGTRVFTKETRDPHVATR
jgi:ribosomal protein S18 acetylase RimI-like enzyme